jgi:hypothetical protein
LNYSQCRSRANSDAEATPGILLAFRRLKLKNTAKASGEAKWVHVTTEIQTFAKGMMAGSLTMATPETLNSLKPQETLQTRKHTDVSLQEDSLNPSKEEVPKLSVDTTGDT